MDKPKIGAVIGTKDVPMNLPMIKSNHRYGYRYKERIDEPTDDQTQSSVGSILIEIWINEIKLAHSMSRRKSLPPKRIDGDQVSHTPGELDISQPSHKLEALWDDLLSRQPERVQEAYLRLEMPERVAVFAHLQRMLAEPGWQAEQRASATAAIQALERLAR